jgi:hypothetical protein
MERRRRAMRPRCKQRLTGWFAAALIAVLAPAAMAQNSETFEMIDPTGSAEVIYLHAPRLTDLEGKVICELSARKWEAPRTFPELRNILQKRYPTARILPFTEFPQGDMVGGIDDDKTAEIVARKGCQAVILGNAG